MRLACCLESLLLLDARQTHEFKSTSQTWFHLSVNEALPALDIPLCLKKHLVRQPGVTPLLIAAMLELLVKKRSLYGKRTWSYQVRIILKRILI